MNDLDRTVRQYLSFLDNPYASAFLGISLAAYTAAAAQRLPPFLGNLFQYYWFKFIVFFLVAYNGSKNPTIAAVSAFVFIVVIVLLNQIFVGQLVTYTPESAPLAVEYDDESLSGYSDDEREYVSVE